MHRLVLFLIMCIGSSACYGLPFVLKGVVGSSSANGPVEGASVVAMRADSTVISTGFSDATGRFAVEMPESPVMVSVSALGYRDVIMHRSGGIGEDLGVIMLEDSPYLLDDLEVVGKLHVRDASKEVFLITDSLRRGSSNTLQLLGRLPGVLADNIDQTIKVGFDVDVPVIINGRMVDKSYVLGLNPKRIRSVEIQRHPTGPYSEYPVLVNVALFDDYVGWDVDGMVSAAASLKRDHSARERVEGNATVTLEQWNLYAMAGFGHAKQLGSEGTDIIFKGIPVMGSLSPSIDNLNSSLMKNSGNFSVGCDYRISPKHTVSVQQWADLIGLNSVNSYLNQCGTSEIVNAENVHSFNSVSGLFYRGSVSRVNLQSIFTYNLYDATRRRSFEQDGAASLTDFKARKNYVNFITSLNWDIARSWSASGTLKYIWRDYIDRNIATGNIDYNSDERRVFAELTGSYFPSSRFNVVGGVSVLNTSMSVSSATQSYTSWMPRLDGYYLLCKNVDLLLNYFCDVEYPTLDQLSPISWTIAPNLVHIGNPELKARVMHYAQLKVDIEKFVTLSYMWKNSANDISPYYLVDSDAGVVVERPVNSRFTHQYLGVRGDWRFANDWRVNLVANYQWYRRKGYADLADSRGGRTWYFDMTASWNVLGSGYEFAAEFFLRHDKLPLLQGFQYGRQETLSFSLSKNFLGGALPVALRMSVPPGILNKMSGQAIEIPDFNYTVATDESINNFRLSVNVRYHIGKGNVRRHSNVAQYDREY